jgi:hypothetical protein
MGGMAFSRKEEHRNEEKEDPDTQEYSLSCMDEQLQQAVVDIYERLGKQSVGTVICNIEGECLRIHTGVKGQGWL